MFRKKPVSKGTQATTCPTHQQLNSQPQEDFTHPRICLIDVATDVHENLAHHYHCKSGSLGALVEVDNTDPNRYTPCLLNYELPPDLHEYDIVIIDLQDPHNTRYDPSAHSHKRSTATLQWHYVSPFPQKLFDPRAASSDLLGQHLRRFSDKPSILIIFAAPYESMNYRMVSIPESPPRDEMYSLYDFYVCDPLPEMHNLAGQDTRICPNPRAPILASFPDLRNLLHRHNHGAHYDVTFAHPTEWFSELRTLVKIDRFIPLMESGTHQIVAFTQVNDEHYTFAFPRFRDKASFLASFIDTVLPRMVPRLYPHHTRFLWKDDPSYRLPNENDLLNEKARIEQQYSDELRKLDQNICSNRDKYSFLHDLLTRTGPDLVDTVELFLRWLGFANVINVDKTNPDLPEEDLRVETTRGLLVIEVKGITGTSTDSDCSQISKVRYRRAEERTKFDVFGLYVVNHQMFIPPLERDNPPFSATQIRDAKNDGRGLVTTFDLFNLYFNIAEGYVSKDAARDSLFEIGLVSFPPSGTIPIPRPHEIHYKGQVAIVNLHDVEIGSGDRIVFSSEGRYDSANVLEIQVDDRAVASASCGEIGIRLAKRINSKAGLWLMANRDG